MCDHTYVCTYVTSNVFFLNVQQELQEAKVPNVPLDDVPMRCNMDVILETFVQKSKFN